MQASSRVAARVANRQKAEAIHNQLLRKESEGLVLAYLDACSGEELRLLCVFHGLKPWGSVGSKAARREALKAVYPRETVGVEVTIQWGKEFNGSYLTETPGRGQYVTVMESRLSYLGQSGRHKYSFAGCPLGSGTTVEGAVQDFVNRGRYEYKGTIPLTREMIEVVKTVDHRTPVEVDWWVVFMGDTCVSISRDEPTSAGGKVYKVQAVDREAARLSARKLYESNR